MDKALAQDLIDAVERELSLHTHLLARLRSRSSEGVASGQPTSARFWGRLLPESEAELWEQMKIAERRRREAVRRATDGTGEWRLSRVISRMPEEKARRLTDLRRRFGDVAASIAGTLRTCDDVAHAA